MLITLSHMVFNILLDLIDDQSYLLHAKTTSFCFTFALVIVNPILFNQPRFLTSLNLVLKIN